MHRATLLIILTISAAFLSACVEISSYSLAQTNSGYLLTVRRDYKGISFGMCGPTTGAYIERELRVGTQKSRYDASEIVEYDKGNPVEEAFTSGFMDVDWRTGRIKIQLTIKGRQFDLNGTFKIKPTRV